MRVFIDTTAVLAVLNANDKNHISARETWIRLVGVNELLVSTNYILLETNAILQNRFGMDAVHLFNKDILPVLNIEWIGEEVHERGISSLLVANRRELSLVDCTSFEVMRQAGIRHAFTFDQHFFEQGFKVSPEF